MEISTKPAKVVILQGLSKAPQLNGKTGTVAAAVDGATGAASIAGKMGGKSMDSADPKRGNRIQRVKRDPCFFTRFYCIIWSYLIHVDPKIPPYRDS